MAPGPPCRICGNADGNLEHAAREMMHGTREPFGYVECGRCGCVSIASIPADLGRHYEAGYYSLQDRSPRLSSALKNRIRHARAAHVFGRPNLLGWLAVRIAGPPAHRRWFEVAGVSYDSSILDVGCGSGWLLRTLHVEGFRHLTGVDPFVAESTVVAPGLTIVKGELPDVRGRFDLVMVHHALEHMPDQLAAMRALRRLATDDGTVLIRIPLAGTWAWRTYGVDWFQLDAPRHLYLHTERSLRLLAASAGLRVALVEYDSTDSQIWRSEQYRSDVALSERPALPPHRIRKQRAAFVRSLNANADGDQACFYLRPG